MVNQDAIVHVTQKDAVEVEQVVNHTLNTIALPRALPQQAVVLKATQAVQVEAHHVQAEKSNMVHGPQLSKVVHIVKKEHVI